jgi:hypothetical protein
MADADFERAFGSLAYAELEQKAPGLFPYLVGFQLVKKTDDETHAIGVFGFKVGDQWYYCPVFWLNGKIKGYDLLYIVSQDLFVPMQESWINYITNRQPYVMGDSVEGKPGQEDFTSPDLTPYTRSPITKQSSYTQAIDDMYLSPMDERYVKVAKSIELTSLHGRPELARTLLSTMNSNTKFAEAVYKFYSRGDIFSMCTAAKQASLRKEAADNFISGNGVKVKVQYGSDLEGKGSMENLSTEQREQMMRGDAIVEDNREPKDTSELYAKPDFERTLTVPNQSGLWDVLVKGPEFKQALVICDPKTIGKARVSGKSTVAIPGDDSWVNVNSSGVCARARIDPDKWDGMFNGFGTVQNMKVDDIGLLVNKQFEGTIPFRVCRIIRGSDGIINMCVKPYDRFKDVSGSSFLYPDSGRYPYSTGSEPCSSNYINYVNYSFDAYDYRCPSPETEYGTKEHYHRCDGYHICFSPKAGGFVNVADTLTVNSDTVRFVKLGRFELEAKQDGNNTRWAPKYDDYSYERGNLDLGKASDIENYLFKQGMYEIDAQPDRDDTISIKFRDKRNHRLTKNAALKLLIEDVGLTESESRTLIKHAKVSRVSGLVKLSAPMAPATSGGFNDTYGTVTTSPSSETNRISSNAPGIDRKQSMEPIDPDAQNQAQQAADAGQKDVFDLAVLNGLIRANDVDEVIRGMVKDIIVGNDRIGRILFLYYWHFDQFTEKYGNEDMKELEDTLRNVFKSTGDLILFLKQKSIEPGASERATVDIGSAPAAAGI